MAVAALQVGSGFGSGFDQVWLGEGLGLGLALGLGLGLANLQVERPRGNGTEVVDEYGRPLLPLA